ncbi:MULTISPECIES: class I SAM-dependent methyltransferase [unclassified Mucilaginibacter]|uniref:class I SAM-dependent methyltransferase n=2 Tax=Mucilaginibacter TaxID=423349 RepID=UPI002B22B948|nr:MULTISPECIES: class I SAM-dependent methyltransferase [unclassified Mucilaginibacter]MEB0260041.1 class I SAM-dependent methyltransferase [Mucilaginibacter sp. 10I4]MEB0280546.1 class I SAM-dependent methyltransferase [Mucilaginibacter sp. 10B2]MEB0301114.1 class I SAM-dependent methyltransferase [Mucilaginibacter sp. 5C4]
MEAYPFSYFPPIYKEQVKTGVMVPFKAEHINYSIFRTDADFDWLYPEHFQLMSQKQWTPLAIARKAAEFLAEPGSKVLDIGSGIGKFCLTGAFFNPEATFFGVEQRHELHHYAKVAKNYTQLDNVGFIHANITQIDFKEFDHFYFFNAFYENIDRKNAIDDTIETSFSLYTYYTEYLLSALKDLKAGTRLVTYQGLEEVEQINFKLAWVSETGLLRMWIKEK